MATEGADLITWTDKAGARHFLNADVVMTFDAEVTAEVTEHPVEAGADVADHVRVKPVIVKLSIGHSNTPIFEEDGFKHTDQTIEYQGLPGALAKLVANTAAGAAIGAGVGAVPGSLGGPAAIGAGAGANAILDAIGINDRPTETAVVHVLTSTTKRERVNVLVTALFQIVAGARPITVAQRGLKFVEFIVTRVGLSYEATSLAKINLECREFRTVAGATAKLPDPKILAAQANKINTANPKKSDAGKVKDSIALSFGKKLGLQQ